MKENYIISKAQKDDIVGIYNLLHREFIKKYSSNSEKSEWKKHKKWYEFWIKSPYYIIYVLKDLKEKILGQVRYEIDGEVAIVNIFLDKNIRGEGYSEEFLNKTLEELKFEKHEVKIVIANILEENEISKKIFLHLGFEEKKTETTNVLEYSIYMKVIGN
ncbi:MAG: GNAT family N-acetyltransferase [Psychrilyobacter sp.]|nr:GNAT family N-acetyltransferase [Psychrilyobacter sp.]